MQHVWNNEMWDRKHSRHGQMIEEEKEFKDAPNYFIKNYFYTAQQG